MTVRGARNSDTNAYITTPQSPAKLVWAAAIALFIASTPCFGQQRTGKPDRPPADHEILLTLGGFIPGGDENQRVEGTCTPAASRDALSCDIYNGLTGWKLTQLRFRVTWSP